MAGSRKATGRPVGAKGKARGALEKIRSFGPEALEALHDAIIAKERWAVEFVLTRIVGTNSRAIEFEDLTTEDVREAFKSRRHFCIRVKGNRHRA